MNDILLVSYIGGDKMMVYEIAIYDADWHSISKDYKRFDDLQQAELDAEKGCAWLGGVHWEVRRIR